MAKDATYPYLFDDCIRLSISDLIKKHYLTENRCFTIRYGWTSRGESTLSIKMDFNTKHVGYWTIYLSYRYNGEDVEYPIYIDSVPSNLGKGNVLYFICPNTQKRCRFLYFRKGYFAHREAFKGGMYKSQTKSKSRLKTDKAYEVVFTCNDVYDELCKKNLKTHYKNKPTKIYLRLTKKVDAIEQMFKSGKLERLLR